jgi:CHASE3 domain sensor protein
MAKSRQSVEGIRTGGKLEQSSDVSSTDQEAKDVDASSLTQRIQSQQTGLSLGRYRAVGATGVIALVVVALAWFVLNYLTR